MIAPDRFGHLHAPCPSRRADDRPRLSLGERAAALILLAVLAFVAWMLVDAWTRATAIDRRIAELRAAPLPAASAVAGAAAAQGGAP